MYSYDKLNPLHTLAITALPSLKDYLTQWLATCERRSIPYGLPQLEQTEEFAYGYPQLLWLPTHGLCTLGRPHGSWALREPFARLGVHTRAIHFWQLDLLLATERVHPEVTALLHESKVLSYPNDPTTYHDNILPLGETPAQVEFLDLLEARLSAPAAQREQLGVFCMFEASNGQRKFSKRTLKALRRERVCWGCALGGLYRASGDEELLAREVMKERATLLSEPMHIRMFDVPCFDKLRAQRAA